MDLWSGAFPTIAGFSLHGIVTRWTMEDWKVIAAVILGGLLAVAFLGAIWGGRMERLSERVWGFVGRTTNFAVKLFLSILVIFVCGIVAYRCVGGGFE